MTQPRRFLRGVHRICAHLSAWVVCFSLAVTAAPARAQMLVEDPANLAQNIEQVTHAIAQIKNQIRQIEAVTSHSGYGDLANGVAERALRRYAPSSWEDSLRVLQGGGLPGDAGDMANAIGALRDAYGALSPDELAAARVPDTTRQAFARSQAAGLLAEGVSSTAFARIEARITGIEGMLDQIERAPDIKATADLQSRITGEMALAQLDVERLQAASDALAAGEVNRRTAAQVRMQRFLAVTPPTEDATVMLEPRR